MLFILLLACLAAASPLAQRQSSCNTPTNRQCWSDGFDIETDYEKEIPQGETKKYTLTLTEVDNYIGGDGVAKTKAMLVNNQFPGPTLTANWGDTLQVTVVNNLETNGTSIHWHGVRQLNTNSMDGTNGITECPVPPNSSRTYTFRATQYGTSWYHSHFSAQYGNGVLGGIAISGPTSANYDVDLGPLLISDWYYGAVDQILQRVSDPNNPYVPGFPGAVPTSDNVLFNGKNINPKGSGGEYLRMNFTQGKSHLLRIVNPSVENTYSISMVNHNFTIVGTDFVAVEPKNVSSLYVAVGQRYDIIIHADQPAGDYWFNVTMPEGPCGKSNNPSPAMIVSYGNRTGTPSDPGTAPPDAKCADSLDYTPVVSRSATDAFAPDANDTLTTNIITEKDGVARVFWPVNNSPMNVSWNRPTLAYVENGTVDSMPREENVFGVAGGVTTYWLIQNNSSIPHPVHLHGHDILILGASEPLDNPQDAGQSLRPFDSSASLATTNPARRDTTTLPSWGWLVVAFETNNPGAWLFHCHVAWHVSQGLSVQFLESEGEIQGAVDLSPVAPGCQTWGEYFPDKDPYGQEDSGI